MLGFLTAAFLCSVAGAEPCSLSLFNSTDPPSPIKSRVANGFAQFQWATDIDVVGGRLQIWNYIKNEHADRGIGVRWPQGRIRAPLTNPIYPGEAWCNFQYPVDAVRDSPDTDAPITYGTNAQEQAAAVFVAEVSPPTVASGTVKASYLDQRGQRSDLLVTVSSGADGKRTWLQVAHPPDVVVGISGLSQALNTEDRRAIIAKTAELNGFKVSVAEFSDFVKSDPYKVLTELYTPTEAEERLKQSFVFFTGDKAFLEVPSGTSTKVTVDLIVLNNKLQPLIASNVSLVVPTGQ